MVGLILVILGPSIAVAQVLVRRRFGVDDVAPWRWASVAAIAGGLSIWVVGEDTTTGFLATMTTALVVVGFLLRGAYLLDAADVGRQVIAVDPRQDWPLQLLAGNAGRPVELEELGLPESLKHRLGRWASTPPAQRDRRWLATGETLVEQLRWELDSNRWRVYADDLHQR
jgi:hypothetical protein